MILHIEEKQEFCLSLKEEKPALNLKLDLTYVGNVYEHYSGTYIVTPKIYAQTMETKDKIMDDDVTVNEIYYNETENLSGGLTAQIGDI